MYFPDIAIGLQITDPSSRACGTLHGSSPSSVPQAPLLGYGVIRIHRMDRSTDYRPLKQSLRHAAGFGIPEAESTTRFVALLQGYGFVICASPKFTVQIHGLQILG